MNKTHEGDWSVTELYGLCREMQIPIDKTKKIQEYHRKALEDLSTEHAAQVEEAVRKERERCADEIYKDMELISEQMTRFKNSHACFDRGQYNAYVGAYSILKHTLGILTPTKTDKQDDLLTPNIE